MKYNQNAINGVRYDVQLSANLIKARMKSGLTQGQLAKKIGTSQPAVARAEAGNIPPTHEFLKRAAACMNMKLLAPRFKPNP